MKKKFLTMALVGTACLALTACGGTESAETTTEAQTTAAETAEEPSETEKEEKAAEPITITFWHDRTSDTDLAFLQANSATDYSLRVTISDPSRYSLNESLCSTDVFIDTDALLGKLTE